MARSNAPSPSKSPAASEVPNASAAVLGFAMLTGEFTVPSEFRYVTCTLPAPLSVLELLWQDLALRYHQSQAASAAPNMKESILLNIDRSSMSRFFCVPFGCKYTIDIDPVPLSGALTTF